MQRKVAGRWIGGKLAEHVEDRGPGRAEIGHGRVTIPCMVMASGKHGGVEINGRRQLGSKSPGRS